LRTVCIVIALAAVLAAIGPAPRRYPIEHSTRETRYGPWRIYYDAPPIPSRNCDWRWYHDDFDGAPDGNDNRYGSCPSFADALNECDEYEDDAAEQSA
jgi:hypothetical protein